MTGVMKEMIMMTEKIIMTEETVVSDGDNIMAPLSAAELHENLTRAADCYLL